MPAASRWPSAPAIDIRPPKGWAPLDLREFAGAHELLYFLVLRNLKLRYKQTVLGAAWAVLQPLLTMAVFTRRFRPARAARLGRAAVPGVRARRAGALDLLRQRAHAGRQQPGGSAAAAHEGLFPAAPAPARRRHRGAGRSRDLVRPAAGGARLVRHRAVGAAARRSRLRAAGDRPARSRQASGSRRSTCAIGTCAT